jgi:L-ascorbate metabolism protein UlaG (beta-lactamase superfamily)
MTTSTRLTLPAGLRLTFLGHASFKIVTEGGKIVFFDPWLTGNPVLPENEKRQDKGDLVLVTHGHGDHLDQNLSGMLERTGAHVVGPPEVIQFLTGRNVKKTLFINKGGTIAFEGLKITMTHALHGSNIQMPDGTRGYTHEASGLILTTESGYKIYHAGDTGIFSEMELIGEIYKPDLVMLPIGDRATMGPLEASYAVRLLAAKQVIPIHYGTFPMLTGTAEDFVAELKNRGLKDVAVAPMTPGEMIEG